MKYLTPYAYTTFTLTIGMILAVLLNRWGDMDLIAGIAILLILSGLVNMWGVGSWVGYQQKTEE